ncbi:n-acetyltransferase 5 [Nannochloropsis oceanica]
MGTLRRFTCEDLLRFNNINLDVLTETYNLGFYLQYLSTWPDYFIVEEAPHKEGRLTSYIMGKAEGKGEKWHGHVTAVTVAPEFRRLGRARLMMDLLEEVSNEGYHAYFVDLFVRVSNTLAIRMYEKFGYSVYRRVLGYYSGEEDAFDMRKALPRDVHKKSVIPLTRPVTPAELEW